MAASATDLLMKVSIATATTLDAPGYTIGDTSVTVASTSTWPTDTGITFAMDEIDANGDRVANSYNEYVGTVASGTSVTNVSHVNGTNRDYTAGATTRVYIPVSEERENRIVTWGTAEHTQLGAHTAITATSIATTAAATIGTTLGVTGATTLTGALTIKSYDGWISTADTWTYVSATTFKITGSDVTTKFPVGTKIKLTQTTPKYFYVTGATFSTDTTVTVTGGSDYSLANAAITSPNLSYDSTPQGFPGWFNYTPDWTSTGTQPAIGNGTLAGKFAMIGKTTHVRIATTFGSTTTYGTASYRYSLPITAAETPQGLASTIGTWGGVGAANYAGLADLVSTTTVGGLIPSLATAGQSGAEITQVLPTTWANTNSINFHITYEAA